MVDIAKLNKLRFYLTKRMIQPPQEETVIGTPSEGEDQQQNRFEKEESEAHANIGLDSDLPYLSYLPDLSPQPRQVSSFDNHSPEIAWEDSLG